MHNLYENIFLTNVNSYISFLFWGGFCRIGLSGGLLSGWLLSGWLMSGWLLSGGGVSVPLHKHGIGLSAFAFR